MLNATTSTPRTAPTNGLRHVVTTFHTPSPLTAPCRHHGEERSMVPTRAKGPDSRIEAIGCSVSRDSRGHVPWCCSIVRWLTNPRRGLRRRCRPPQALMPGVIASTWRSTGISRGMSRGEQTELPDPMDLGDPPAEIGSLGDGQSASRRLRKLTRRVVPRVGLCWEFVGGIKSRCYEAAGVQGSPARETPTPMFPRVRAACASATWLKKGRSSAGLPLCAVPRIRYTTL